MRARLAVLVAVAVTLAAGVSGCALMDPGSPVTEQREIPDVTAVVLAAPGDLVIALGVTPSLTVTAGENIIDRLTSRVSGEQLELGSEQGPLPLRGDIRYDLVVSTVSSVTIRGSGSVDVDFTGAQFVEVDVNGSGEVRGAGIDADSVVITINGSGEVDLAGSSVDQRVEIRGSGDYDGRDLTTSNAAVTIAGSGEVELTATETLDVRIAGSGSVRHTGGAQVTSDISGSGQVTDF